MINNKYLRKIQLLLSVIIPGILIFLFHNKTPFIFETNDDVFLHAIVSGEITGMPNPQMIHVGYPVGLLLATLYCLFPTMPWYGLFMCGSIGLTMTVVLHKMRQTEKNTLSQTLTLILFSFGSYAFLCLHITELQFTFVTTFVGAGALFLLIFSEPKGSFQASVKENLGFILLSVWSCCIRGTACIILLPFSGVLFFLKYLYADANTGRGSYSIFSLNKQRKNILALALIYLGLLAAISGIQFLSTSSEEWNTYTKFSEKRASVVDYAGFPEYDTHKALYDSMGITRASYESIRYHYGVAFEPNLTLENMTKLAEISQAEARPTLSTLTNKLGRMVSQFWERHINYADRPLNLLVYAFYLLFFICAVTGKKNEAIWEILFTGVARMVIWTYLMYIDRYPTRVTQGVYAAELFMLLGIAWKNKLWDGAVRAKATRICWIATIALFVAISLRFGVPKVIGAGYESRGRLNFSQSYEDMKAYFSEHPDNFYYLDTNSFGNFTREALTGGREEYGNFMFTGSWLPKSPLYDEKLRREGITNVATALFEDPHVYVVFMDSDITGYEYLEKLYREDYDGRVLKNVEDVITSNGLLFHIMKVYAPE